VQSFRILKGKISRFINKPLPFIWMLKMVFRFSFKFGVYFIHLRLLLENISGLKCKWVLWNVLQHYFSFTMKWRGFAIPVTQSTRRMTTRKKSCDGSDSSELEYRIMLFDNIKTCLQLHTFFWFTRTIGSVSVFVSLLAAATRMLKYELFYWKKSLMFLCVTAATYFLI